MSKRLISVLEHELVPVVRRSELRDALLQRSVVLDDGDVERLLVLNKDRPGFCERTAGGVKFAQHCGLVQLPNCVIEVLPKIGFRDEVGAPKARARQALLRLLLRAQKLIGLPKESVGQGSSETPLLDVFIEAFLLAATEQARRGLLSRYVLEEDDLPRLRGSFQVRSHMRRNLGRPQLVACAFDEHTSDNAYNRAVRAALDACQSWIGTKRVQRLWLETSARFAHVASVPMTARMVEDLPVGRLTRRYKPVLDWSAWILSFLSPSLALGTKAAPCLLFDMNKLFEQFVYFTELAGLKPGQSICAQGPRRSLASGRDSDVFEMKPDLSIWNGTVEDGRCVRIIDAKWKALDVANDQLGVVPADAYQVLAYAVHYDARQIDLVYPSPDYEQPPVEGEFTIKAFGGTIVQMTVRSVDIWR